MSYTGSPYCNRFNQDEYDYDDDRFDDDDHDNEDPDESDEDTEDASETDTGHYEEHMEIKEQVYQDNLATLKKKLLQLKEGTHHDYNKRVKKLENIYKEAKRLNAIYREYMIECIQQEYIREKRAACKEFEEKKIDLKETLISDYEDKRRTVESERYTMELTGDSMEVKPVMTRKLRRRPNDPMPVPEKRRKAPMTQLVYVLDDKEVETDLKKILAPYKKPIESISANPLPSQSMHLSTSSLKDELLVETKVEDGKLLYERRWFHRGQPVYIEGRDMPKFPGNISAIANDAISIKKMDNSKVKISISNLARGKISIKRRAQ